MYRAAGSPAETVHVLITFRRMFCEINSSAKHPSDISMTFVETFLNYCIDERRTVKQHSFVRLIVVFVSNFVSSMGIPFP